jgi:hypothetical protein
MGGKLKIAVIAAATALAMAAPASASAQAGNSSIPTCGPGGPYYVNAQCISENYAGLLAIGYGPYSIAEASWQQPATSALVPLGYGGTGIWVGIGGASTNDTAPPVQIGTMMSTGLQAVGIGTGQCALPPCYSAVWETPATSKAVTIPGFAVHPGDEMTASVKYGNSGFQMTLLDSTTGKSWSSPVIKGNYSRDTAEVIVELPDVSFPAFPFGVAPFGSVQFTHVQIGGLYAVQMVGPNGSPTLVSTSLPSEIVTFQNSY